MTLLITLISPWGVWMSSDTRISWTHSGVVADDFSTKSLEVLCPDGRFFMMYTGVGEVRRHVSVMDWARRQLRGANRPVGASLEFLTERATRDLSRFRMPHIFGIIEVMNSGERCISTVRNVSGTGQISPTFTYTRRPFESHECFAIVDGAAGAAVTFRERQFLERMATRKPPRAYHGWKLLACINKRAASRTGGASASSTAIIMFWPFDNDEKWKKIPVQRLGPEYTIPGFIMLGIDQTEIQNALIAGSYGGTDWADRAMKAGEESTTPDP